MALEDMDPRSMLDEGEKAYNELSKKLDNAEAKIIALQAMIDLLAERDKRFKTDLQFARARNKTLADQLWIETHPEDKTNDDDQEQETLPFV
jgi:predicted  nucleic acid-binding Zn-ribbon protein